MTMSITSILVVFLLQLSIGMMMTVTLLPTSIVAKPFFRSISFWAVFFTLMALVFQYFSSSHLISSPSRVNLLFGIFALLFWLKAGFACFEIRRTDLFLVSAVGILALVLDSLALRPPLPPLWAQSVLLPLHFISASLILGGFLTGMIFGHFYLVNTDMPKRLLLNMAWILVGVVVFRVLAVATTLLLHRFFIHPHEDFLASLLSFEGHGIFFWQRVLIGLFMPSVVVGLIYGTAKIGSNQSATGIMYVAIAFVFIGELAARYLFLLSGIPL